MKKSFIILSVLLLAFPIHATAFGKDVAKSADNAAGCIFPEGRLTLGVNYWGSVHATDMWARWDAAAVEADLKQLAGSGFKVLRVFPNWRDFQPIVICPRNGNHWNEVMETRMFLSEEPLPDTPCGRAGVDERMVEHFEEFCDIADKYGLKLIVPLLTGQMTFRNFVPPALYHLNPFSDPYALKWEAAYLECMVTRLKEKKAIIAWESGNESRILGECASAEHAEVWLRYVHDIIRLADPSRPVIGVDGVNIADKDKWKTSMVASLSDYVTTHPYGMFGKVYLDDICGIRSGLFCAARTSALEDIAAKPAFIEEHGQRRQEQCSQEHLADYMRGMLWNSWAAGCRAMLWWCAYDQTDQTIAPYDWPQPCVELGILHRDRTPYPALRSVSDFAAMQASLSFDRLPAAERDAVFIVKDQDVLLAAYVLARQAGIIPVFQTPEQALKQSDVYFIPTAHGRAGLTIRRWNELKERVRQGATLYLSWDDTFLDSAEDVTGVHVAYREGHGKTTLEALTAEVVCSSAAGSPELFRNKYGNGTVYTLSHPIEREIIEGTGGFDSDAYRVYATVLPRKTLVSTPERDITVSVHPFDQRRCAVILVNNSPRKWEGVPEIEKGWKVKSAVSDSDHSAWNGGSLRLDKNSGILLMLEK